MGTFSYYLLALDLTTAFTILATNPPHIMRIPTIAINIAPPLIMNPPSFLHNRFLQWCSVSI
jgi:hypothetical protein